MSGDDNDGDDNQFCYVLWLDETGQRRFGGEMQLGKLRAIENRPDLNIGDTWRSHGFFCRLEADEND